MLLRIYKSKQKKLKAEDEVRPGRQLLKEGVPDRKQQRVEPAKMHHLYHYINATYLRKMDEAVKAAVDDNNNKKEQGVSMLAVPTRDYDNNVKLTSSSQREHREYVTTGTVRNGESFAKKSKKRKRRDDAFDPVAAAAAAAAPSDEAVVGDASDSEDELRCAASSAGGMDVVLESPPSSPSPPPPPLKRVKRSAATVVAATDPDAAAFGHLDFADVSFGGGGMDVAVTNSFGGSPPPPSTPPAWPSPPSRPSTPSPRRKDDRELLSPVRQSPPLTNATLVSYPLSPLLLPPPPPPPQKPPSSPSPVHIQKSAAPPPPAPPPPRWSLPPPPPSPLPVFNNNNNVNKDDRRRRRRLYKLRASNSPTPSAHTSSPIKNYVLARIKDTS